MIKKKKKKQKRRTEMETRQGNFKIKERFKHYETLSIQGTHRLGASGVLKPEKYKVQHMK